MILKILRQQTSERHAAVEARLPLVDPALSRAAYEEILKRFYGFYLPLEARLLAVSLWREIGFEMEARRKVSPLEWDLEELSDDAELARLPRCAELPEIACPAQALGCLYVVEGATLGGQIITKHLQKNLGITPETGGAFFAGYGAETGARWQEFGAMITAQAGQLGQDDVIVASANRTFETLEHWLFR
jgi:heme oxygenase